MMVKFKDKTIDLDPKFYANEVAYVELNGKVQKLQVIWFSHFALNVDQSNNLELFW